MNNAKQVYAKAVKTLKPSMARMAAIHAASAALNAQAKQELKAEMAANGLDAQAMYSAYTANHRADQSKLEIEKRVILLGMVRRGLTLN